MQPKTTPQATGVRRLRRARTTGAVDVLLGHDISRGAVAPTAGASRSRRSPDSTVALRDGDFTGFAAEIVGPSRGTAGRYGRRRAGRSRRRTRGDHGVTRPDEQSGRTRPWGKSVQRTQRRLMGSSLGPTTVLKHLWVRAASGFWRGIWAATPNMGCPVRRWRSGSRRRPPTTFGRRAQRQGPW